jgi:hypothetical protein
VNILNGMAENKRVVKETRVIQSEKRRHDNVQGCSRGDMGLSTTKMEKLTLINSRTEDEMNEFRAWGLLLSMDLPTEEAKKVMAAMDAESEPQNRVKLFVIQGGLG